MSSVYIPNVQPPTCRLKNEPQTHGDQIRAKTDEELAAFFMNLRHSCPPWDCPGGIGCENCWLEWLRKKAENG